MPYQKKTQSETDFFTREEAEKKHKLQQQREQEGRDADLAARKKLHFMKCPKCGSDLKAIPHQLVDADQCENCGAIVLASGDLEKLTMLERSVLKDLINIFRD